MSYDLYLYDKQTIEDSYIQQRAGDAIGNDMWMVEWQWTTRPLIDAFFIISISNKEQ